MDNLNIKSGLFQDNGKRINQNTTGSLSRTAKVETIFNDDGSKTERVYYRSGKITKESIFKDINGDGKEDIYSVTNFYEEDQSSNPANIAKTFIDKDGDGYHDVVITKTYDKNGHLKHESRIIAEDINSVKNREHLDSEVKNREMEAHHSGFYIM